MTHPFDARPIIVALAGPNGAGKSTFYDAFLSSTGLRFINADDIASELAMDPYDASLLADGLRRELVDAGESFIFETVLSDPVGAKVGFLADAHARGYQVVVCFIGLDSAATSDERVAMRVLQGGHDVPMEKVRDRYARSLQNLALAILRLRIVWVYDNSDLATPFRKIAECEAAHIAREYPPMPAWFQRIREQVVRG